MKPKKKYVRVKDRRVGLKAKDRPTPATKQHSNQWIDDPRHMAFANAYFTPTSPTHANAYQTGIAVGFSDTYSRKIAAKSTGLEWLSEARRMLKDYKPEHIWQSYMHEYETADRSTDRLHALDSMAKVAGMFVDRSIQQIDVQFTNSVPRPTQKPYEDVIDVTPTDTTQDTE